MKRHGILRSLLGLMSHESAEVRVATIWVLINLTWLDEKGSSSSFSTSSLHDRIKVLRSMGIEERLRALNSDHDLDVRDRVKTALHQFSADQQQPNQHHAHAHSHGHGHGVAPSDANSTGGPHGRHLAQSPTHRPQQSGYSDAQESTAMVTDPSGFSNEASATTSDAAQQTIAGAGLANHERR